MSFSLNIQRIAENKMFLEEKLVLPIHLFVYICEKYFMKLYQSIVFHEVIEASIFYITTLPAHRGPATCSVTS